MSVKRKRDEEGPRQQPQSSLTTEDGAFPRGGGSNVLTPLEIKQVTNEAARDLFASESSNQKKKSKKQKKFRNKNDAEVKKVHDKVKIDGLSFSKLSVGSMVLGQVVEIGILDITLSLPNNLVGYVPITNISAKLSERIDKQNEEDEGEDEDEEEDENEDVPQLSKLFKIGQYLRALVVENEKVNNKRRIELSIDPLQTNEDIELDDLSTGNSIQGSIQSVEDHGVIIDIGRDNISGFLSNKELSFANIDQSELNIGQVLLMAILSKSSNGRILTLTASANAKKVSIIKSVSLNKSLLAGTLVNVLITDIKPNGLIGKIFGSINTTIDTIHSGVVDKTLLEKTFKEGSTVKARIIYSPPSSSIDDNDDENTKVLSSLLQTSVELKSPDDANALPIGRMIESTIKIVDAYGLFVDIGTKSPGFVHVSRISDTRIDDLTTTNAYSVGKTLPVRVLGYSYADNLYNLSAEKSLLEQKFLRVEDVPTGEKINGVVESILPRGGLMIKLWDGCTAIANDIHLSDIKLVHPERKFKPGMKVSTRVLKVDKERNRIQLTLKKSLVNTDDVILTSYDQAVPGLKTPGTIITLQAKGAVVEFFGGVRGYLPVSEISEAFVKDPKDHLKIGQSVAVRVISVEPEAQRLLVSCRNDSSESKAELASLEPGSIVSAVIVEKTKDGVVVDVTPHHVRGVLTAGHLTDGNDTKVQLKKLKVGETLETLVVLEKDLAKRFVTLSAKPSIIEDSKADKFPNDLSQIKIGDKLHGYVKTATSVGVFVRFGGKLTGLALKQDLSTKSNIDPTTKFVPSQSIECFVIDIDDNSNRFLLSLHSTKRAKSNAPASGSFVDESIISADEFIPGKVTKAQIVSVKETQLNVRLANNIQGRIDVSQIYDDYESIPDPKNPLGQFQKNQVVDVKIIGFHDARNHSFLAISHRSASHLVYELSAKKSDLESSSFTPLTLEDVERGSSWLTFINNLTVDFVWVNLSPSVRGRVHLIDLTDNVDELEDVESHYPIGSALKCSVIDCDSKNNNLKLSVRANTDTAITDISNVQVGQTLPGFVTKVTDVFVGIRLGGDIAATSFAPDALDDYSLDLKMTYLPHQLVKAKVISVDVANKKIAVNIRPSQTSHNEGETVAVVDRYIEKVDDVKVDDVLRGFVKNVADGGLFISLGNNLTARVQIKNLSDSYLKDWKKYFKVGQVVSGKIVSIDDKSKRLEMTLKESVVTGKDPLSGLSTLNEGDIYDGIIKKVESFGVFVLLDGTSISGLCHRSEVADVPLQDLTKVFAEGDRVKVKILKVDLEKNRLALGLKASYFTELESDVEMDLGDDDEEGVIFDEEDDEDEEEDEEEGGEEEEEEEEEDEDEEDEESDSDVSNSKPPSAGLSVGFDWTGNILDQITHTQSDDEDDEVEEEGRSRKRRKKSKIVEDKTGTLNTKLPQSVTDFERLLVGSPNSSIMWMNYMAFQIQLSEIEKAREIGQRALKSINFREEQERLNIWIALLNLENSFGTDQTVEDTFKEAIQFMDSKTIHLKLASIYSQSEGKSKKAEQLYDATMKKFGGEDLSVWITYANFLFDNNNGTKARSLLDRALKMLPGRNHKEIITKFAQLEYNKGEAERGRTLFEGLISSYPRRIDLWIVYLDYEIKNNDKELVEKLFERVIDIKLSMKQAKFFFKKWLNYEDKVGDEKKINYVKAKAGEYVSSRKSEEE